MAETRFISDLHMGHANCLKFDKRPFSSIEEQDEIIIANHNSVMRPSDTCWILGDFSWYNPQKTIEVFKRFNGHLNLVVGNHDRGLLKNRDVCALFDEIVEVKELYFDKKKMVTLYHYPSPCFNKHLYGAYHLYGHVHNSFEQQFTLEMRQKMIDLGFPCKMYNVGCMMPEIDYTPRTLEEIVTAYGDSFK